MAALHKITRGLIVKKFERGQMIIQQDEILNRAHMVKDGIVKCYDISLDGSEQLIWLVRPGDMFPTSYVFGHAKQSLFFYSAFIDTELYSLDRDKLVKNLKADPDLLFELCREVTERFHDLHFRINASNQPKALEKVLHTLAFLADRFPVKTRGDNVEVSLPLTHQDIASLVGLTRETTAVTLKKLMREGFIHYDRTSLTIYRDKIENELW